MPEHDEDELDVLISRSSLGTPGARELRRRTTPEKVDAARARLADLLVEQGDVAGLRARADAGDAYSAYRLAELLAEQGEVGYPIIERRWLEPLAKTGLMGLGARQRNQDEIPKAHAHQVLVYRVDGDYVLDNARLGSTHEYVVNASHVSLVDIRHRAPVLVRLTIPSADARAFVVYVTFACTVNDPVTVVREGHADAETVLRGYLESHQELFELGLGYCLADINQVRINVNAHVKAYTTIRPPVISGMSITTAGVVVLTPSEVAEYENQPSTRLMDAEWELEHDELRLLMDIIRHDPSQALWVVGALFDAGSLAKELMEQAERQRQPAAAVRREMADREAQQVELEAQIGLIRELAARGHLDMVNIKLERLLGERTDDKGTEDTSALTGSDPQPVPPKDVAPESNAEPEMQEEDDA